MKWKDFSTKGFFVAKVPLESGFICLFKIKSILCRVWTVLFGWDFLENWYTQTKYQPITYFKI